MAPKPAKRLVKGPGPRKGHSKPATSVADEPAEVEPVPEVKQEVKLEVTPEVKPEVTVVIPESANQAEHEDTKEAFQEADKGEQLELEDNEPDNEHEDEAEVDYDENDIEHEELEEDEEYDQEVDVEEEAEMADELDDGADGLEGDELDNAEEGAQVDVEEEERHEVVKEHRKRKEFEIFVGGLDKDATEDDLRKVFSQAGEIVEVRLMMNSATKKNKGFAFLRFASVEEAKRAVSELKNPSVCGKTCGVAPSHDNDTLFVGNICKTWTKEHLKETLKGYGVENFYDLVLVEDSQNEGMNRGYALLEFESRTEAMDAFRLLQKKDVAFGVDRPAKITFADTYPSVDDEIMKAVKTVFIDGIHGTWDEERVKKYLKKFGAIEKVELARNMPAARRNDFGFVTFDTHDNAVACAEGINNKELGEGHSKAKVRARLSRPLQRPGLNRGLRGNYRMARGGPHVGRFSHSRMPPPRRPPPRPSRTISSRVPPPRVHSVKRPANLRDRRPAMAVTERPRRLPPPESSYERRPPVPVYSKSASRRDYVRRDELPPPRSRPAADFDSRVPIERRSYREDYSLRGPAYPEFAPRGAARAVDRRAYYDDGYEARMERQLPPYREGRSRGYATIAGSKRSYEDVEVAPSRYHEMSIRQTKPRNDYDAGGSSSRYSDPYGDRAGRYTSSRPISGQDGLYGGRHDLSYSGGSLGGSDVRAVYPSTYSSNYLRETDVGGDSFYSTRNLGGSSYYSGRDPGSYY